ncbi:cupin domain-containing protein [Sandaracinus amylolyticus]|uniref:DUF985 domain-containing protein n=1 Tax=Sandaracinus amylolyticus TaxID=927083 RepID=A0A0F6SGQ9_9BACT|nr:cupin domain-containing protein [Sandaracinus amylolyticus]AKF09124.1 Hypothetical protein DB32_006273 [Sandaracinus amylolyticus]
MTLPTERPPTADELATQLGLAPHPEGGFYRETYRASTMVDTPRGPRAASTAIYFLVPRGAFSALHRIASDEVWHHYAGAALRVVRIAEDGARGDLVIGPGGAPQGVVEAGAWFGATIEGDGDWALVGCTVAPGFDFADFELAQRADLIARFPQHAQVITALTRS